MSLTRDEQVEVEAYKADASVRLEGYRAEQQIRIELYKHQLEIRRMLARGTLEFGTLGVKSLILVNGAAVIALLTFVGNYAKTYAASSVSFEALSQALASFAWGTGTALVVAMLSYISQALIAEMPQEKDGSDAKEGTTFRYAAITVAALSMLLFLHGVLRAVQAFQ